MDLFIFASMPTCFSSLRPAKTKGRGTRSRGPHACTLMEDPIAVFGVARLALSTGDALASTALIDALETAMHELSHARTTSRTHTGCLCHAITTWAFSGTSLQPTLVHIVAETPSPISMLVFACIASAVLFRSCLNLMHLRGLHLAAQLAERHGTSLVACIATIVRGQVNRQIYLSTHSCEEQGNCCEGFEIHQCTSHRCNLSRAEARQRASQSADLSLHSLL